MDRGAETHSAEITLQAERVINTVPPSEKLVLRKANDALAADPEPDGVTKFVAPAALGYSGCLLNEVYPWRLVYQVVGPDRLIVVAIQIHPNRAPMM